MAETLRTVRLYGVLGATFGREFRLAVASPAEAVRALCVQLPGFERFLNTSRERGLVYAVFYGKRNLTEDELHLQGDRQAIRIAPILEGSKNSGLVSTIVGAVLVVAGAAINFFSAGALSFIGTPMIYAGVGMMVGGVVQMLSPQVGELSGRESPDNKPSYAFGGPVNTVAQGRPVGLGYGRRRIGGAIISGGIYAEDLA
ncbi:MAG: tail assembly protein [Alcanivorax sp.]|nr:tail assembly protein [Alcanivorax sp.]